MRTAERTLADPSRATWWFPHLLPTLVRTAIEVGAEDLAEAFTAALTARTPLQQHSCATAQAAVLEARGGVDGAIVAYQDAVNRWAELGQVPELSFALLGHGRCPVAAGRQAEATPILQRARSIFEGLRAVPSLVEIDRLLAERR